MSDSTRIIPICTLALVTSACVGSSALLGEQPEPSGLERLQTGSTGAERTELPTAYTDCGGTPDDLRSVFTDDTSPQAVYSAPWKAETPGLGLYQGTQHITNIGGYKVSHTFSTSVWDRTLLSYGYRKMRSAGKAAIYWDDQYFATVSLYAPDNVYYCELVFYDIPQGVHTVMVKVLNQREPASGGTYVNLDYFRQYDY
jgi:hypothetical protein